MTVFGGYAKYYDVFYRSKDYSSEADFTLRLLRKHCPNAQSLLELGCGTGGHAQYLCSAGLRVHGIDRSEEMLEFARKRRQTLPADVAQQLSFSAGDIRDITIDNTFDAVISLFHVMSYQLANEDLRATFATAKRHLRPGGLFIFDCWYGPGVLTDRPAVRVNRWTENGTNVTRISEPTILVNQNLVEIDYTILVEERASTRTETLKELHKMRYLFLPEIEMLASLSDMQIVESLEWMSDRAPSPESWSACFVLRG